MPGDKPRPTGPTWRNAAKPAARSSNPRQAWKKEAPAPGTPTRGWSRKVKFGLLGLAFLLLGGVLAYWVFLLRTPKPPHLVLIGAGNAANLRVPANVAGTHSLDALEQWAHERDQIKVARVELSADGAPWDQWLAERKSSAVHKGAQKVILFVAAHGGADSQAAYLIPHHADPSNRARLLRLTVVLDRLRELPDATPKLLILDTTQVSAHWALGIFQNDFVRALKELEPKINDIPNLAVLCASDEEQRSWVSEEWGQTIFAHHVIEGLKGAAEKRYGRIYLSELFEHVRKNVKQWVRDNRDALQEPILLGGMDRARGIDLVEATDYHEPKPPELKPVADAVALRESWDEARKLTQRSPAVVAPQLYRQYLDTLLRYEQLLRLGDHATADQLRAQLNQLRRQIDGAGRLPLHSAGAALAMGTAFEPALSPKEEEELTDAFKQLWSKEAPRDDYKKLYQASANKTARRLKLLAELFDKVIEDPQRNLSPACAVLPALDDVAGPRPAEVHFMAMLQRGDLAANADWALIRKALEVRKLAEEAALGLKNEDAESRRLPGSSELVYPWIRKTIEEADLKRQLGQDLLYASEPGDQKKSGELLDQARQLHLQAQDAALEVRRALLARDQLLAALPYYTHWLARRRAADEPLFRKAEALWKQLHELDRLLDRPGPERALLVQRTKEVNEAFEALRSSFDKVCNDLAESFDVVLQSRWHEVEDVLVVPFIEPALRLRLLEYSRKIGHTLATTKKAGEGQAVPAQKNHEQARVAVRQQARMALAVLGAEWFDALNIRPDYQEVEKNLERPDETEAFTRASEQTALHWNRRAAEARQRTEAGRAGEQLDKVAIDLRPAAQVARHLDGAAALHLASLNPIDEHRRVQVHDLLLWQGERTFRDHWASENAGRPYYRTTGQTFVRDARGLAGEDRADLSKQQKAGRLTQAVKLGEKLDLPGELTAGWFDGAKSHPGPVPLVLTDEERFERIYKIEAPQTVDEGYPVVWVERGNWLQPAAGTSDAARRVLMKLDAKTRGDTASFELVPQTRVVSVPHRDDTKHVLHGVFRGQRFEVRTDIQLHRKPDMVAYQQRLPLGAVAVQAPRELYDKYRASNTAIAILLDCSGSMCAPLNPGDPPKPGVQRRFDKALDAIEEVLRRLPPGVTVSLRTFSQKAKNGAATLLWNQVKWDPAATDGYMGQLRKIEPWFGTPLIRSIEQAKDDFPRDFKGFKTLVIITDGGDSDETVPVDDIPTRLTREFRDSGILINAIGFDPSYGTKREERAAEKFQEALRRLGGNHFDVKDKNQLVGKLKESMLNMRFWLERHRDGVPPPQVTLDGRNISQVAENTQWVEDLPPSLYNLEVRVRANQSLRRTISIDRGDFLLLNLIPQGDRFLFERDLYAESYARFGRPVQKAEDMSRQWLAAVMQNQHRQDGTLQLMTTVEKIKDRAFEGGTQQQVRPRLALFQVRPQAGKSSGPLALRSGGLAGYPAPAWGLDVEGWPRDVAPVFDAWWSDDDLHAVDDDHPYARILKRDVHFDLGTNHRKVRAKLAPGEWTEDVILESVRIERRTVETRPGVVEQEIPCLVVRLRHPEGKPFLVQVRRTVSSELRGYTGHEHRFYSAAGKYTGIFWGWTEEELRKELNLELISVEGFKKRASHVHLDLATPDARPRPQPVNIPLHYDERR